MEQTPQPQENKEKLIHKLEVVFSDLGSPRQTVSIKIEGKSDPSFLLGFGKFFKAVSMEELQRIFPYLVESSEGNKLKLKTRDLIQLLKDTEGLQELSKYLGTPIEIIKESRGKVIESHTINSEE